MTINFSEMIHQILLRKIAFALSSYHGDNVYYEKEIIDIMISIVGEEQFVNMLINDNSNNKKIINEIGQNWYKPIGMKNKLHKMQKVIEQTKVAYDMLNDKTLKKKNSNEYDEFSNRSKVIANIKTQLTPLFVFAIENSALSSARIPPQYMKILQEKNPKIGKLGGDDNEGESSN